MNETARPILTKLLSPMTVKTFFEECWEKKHCVFRRNNATYYDEWFKADQLDAVRISMTNLITTLPQSQLSPWLHPMQALNVAPLRPDDYSMHKDDFKVCRIVLCLNNFET